MRIFKLIGVAIGVLAFAGGASAQLTGTSLDITQSFTGVFATTTMGPHVYGGPPTIYPDPGFPQFTWTATSPAPLPPAGFDNSIFCDYALFALPDFAGETTNIILSGIDVEVGAGTARVINSAGTQIGLGTSGGATIDFTIAVNDILAGPTPSMTVAWDSGGVCYPDCNNSGGLTVADFTCFQGQFLLQTVYGDCNGSGTWTVADFTCFQIAYLNGCP